MAIDDGGPAFPHEHDDMNLAGARQQLGMTLRDYFAGQVICGYLFGATRGSLDAHRRDALGAADVAYAVADAMIAERAKQ